MLPDIDRLLELQVADQEIRRLRDEVAALPRRVAAIEHRLASTRAHLEAIRAAAKGDEADRKKYEAAIKDLQGKISKYRDQSLDVKTNEQYKALMAEIGFAEAEIAHHEDGILNVMVAVEGREKELKLIEAQLKAEAAEVEREKEEARKVTAEDQAKLADWNAKRDALRAQISEDVLRQYERVAKFRGTGLAEVRGQKCMGCQVMLRPQTYNDVTTGTKVMACESCQRIYYYNPANEVKPEQEVATVTGRKRARPKAEAPQAWFYRPDYGEEGEVLLAYINNGGNSARRIYEMHTGRQIGGVLAREGTYRLAFPEDLTDSALRLNGHWDEAEIDEWGTEIPSNALDLLHKDILAIRREHKAAHKDNKERAASSSTAEHTAAS